MIFTILQLGNCYTGKIRLAINAKFDDYLRISFTQFLNEQNVGPQLSANGRFSVQHITVLQDYLINYGARVINNNKSNVFWPGAQFRTYWSLKCGVILCITDLENYQ